MKEGEQEEAENFIPSCFRAFADMQGKSLKAGEFLNILKFLTFKKFKESTISIEHFRFIMQSLPKGECTRRGD